MKKKSTNFTDLATAHDFCDMDAALNPSTDHNLAGKVHDLLHALREIEEFSERLSDAQFRAVIHEAILACGFEDEVDAWQVVMDHLRCGACNEASCQYHIPLG